MNNNQKIIRFGILCRELILPDWQFAAIKKLLEEQDIQLELIILDQAAHSAKSHNKGKHIWRFFQTYFIKKWSKASRPKDISLAFKNTSVFACKTTEEEKGTPTFESEAISHIRGFQLDFIIAFGMGSLFKNAGEMCKYGIWSFRHDHPDKALDLVYGFWEVYENKKVTSSYLQGTTGSSDQVFILKEGHFKTHFSYLKNRDNLLRESSDWLRQACVDIRYDQLSVDQRKTKSLVTSPLSIPSNRQMISFFFRSFKKIVRKALYSIFYTDYWNIGVARAPIQDFLTKDTLPEITWYPRLPKHQFIADPFALYLNNRLDIIYEAFPFITGVGELATMHFDGKTFSEPIEIIREPFHMSYPFLLTYKDEIYCIPETYQANQVRLYKAISFPESWQFQCVLIEGYAGIDNTPFYFDQTWWLFSTDRSKGSHHYRLNIFYADDLLGDWTPHPKNPVKTDIRSSRPAGTLFEYDGDIYRPSMDYSEKVEGRIVINKVLKLTKTDYSEVAVKTINPATNTFFSDKTHTLCQAGPYTIIDGAKELFVLTNPYALIYKIKSKWRKIFKSSP